MGIPKGGGRKSGWKMSEKQKKLLADIARNKIPSTAKRIAAMRIAINSLVKKHRMTREDAAVRLAEYAETL
ncbi:Uncharacterised protein [uncultured archaeon]|nr:Uncharacterised protein [uncultured archaeon]